MNLDPADLVLIFDRIGIVAFAISGVQVGTRRNLDVFGLLIMGLVTATGGGVMRDVVLGRLPLLFERDDYLLWALGASIAAVMLVAARRRLPPVLVSTADAIGLGAFAVAGAFAAIEAELSVIAVVLLGVLTATGGGAIRDLLADRVPMVLRSEVNATAAAMGAFAVWAAEPVNAGLAALIGALTAAVVRIGGMALGINLPVPGVRKGK